MGSLQPLINVANLRQQPVDLSRVVSPIAPLQSAAVLQAAAAANLPSAGNPMQQANLASLQNANLKANLTPPNKAAIVQNPLSLGQKSAALLYGLTGLQTGIPGAQFTGVGPSKQPCDHRASSALDNKLSKTSDKRDIESSSLHSCGPALMTSEQQPSRSSNTTMSNLYFGAIDTSSLTLEQLNQLNQLSQLNQLGQQFGQQFGQRLTTKRPLSPNRSPLYLVHQQQSTGRSAPEFEQPPIEPKRSAKKEPPENERLLNEIQQLKENLKRMESERETLTGKLNRNEGGLADQAFDLQTGKSERSARPVDKLDKATNRALDKAADKASDRAGKADRAERSDRTERPDKTEREKVERAKDRKEKLERMETTKTDKIDKNDKIVNKDTQERKRIKAPEKAGISGGQEELRPVSKASNSAASTSAGQAPGGQLNVGHVSQTVDSGSKPISSGQQIETRLDIEDDEPFSYEEDSERNRETII